jgi:hypothetical protein
MKLYLIGVFIGLSFLANNMYLRIILILCVILAPALVFGATPESFLYVKVRESKLRQDPQFWAPTVANLPYGTKLSEIGAAQKDSQWLKVKFDASEGYVHISAVTKRRVVLGSAGVGGDKVDPSTVVLAGKGFNRQVEQSYASSKGLDFKSVDEVEQYHVDSSEGAAFVKDGKLSEG